MTIPAAHRVRRHPLARLGLVLLPPAAMLAALAVTAGPAAANPAGPHDPIGKLEKVTASTASSSTSSAGSVHLSGWAADPDTTANVQVRGVVDGTAVTAVNTSIARPRVVKRYQTGPTPGFSFDVPVPATGVHTVCLSVHNIGAGMWVLLDCRTTPLGTHLSSSALAAHSPYGKVKASASHSSLHVQGWAVDPDYRATRLTVVLYVDGVSTETVVTGKTTAAQRAAGAGAGGAYDISVPVSSGAHLACMWLVNTGYGSNTSPGCTPVDTRGRAGTGTVQTPAANTKALKEAKRHIGQPYVWGAEGPKKFDCSGLVMYSYHKAGVTTPRVAADQFHAARVIPASRAVPGDLVFYHDGVGAVYHVGIYVSPGDTVAAIDEAEGIHHQHIWDPSTATYGSFTHT